MYYSVFSKVGRLASEEVVISLLRVKCLPVLLYSVEACSVLVRDKQSLEFTISCSLIKLFRTESANVVTDCQKHFKFSQVSYQLTFVQQVLEKFAPSENLICSLFAKQSTDNMQKIFLKYGNNIKSNKPLIDIIEYTFFCM